MAGVPLRATATTAQFVSTLLLVGIAIVSLLFVDAALARLDERESVAAAAEIFAEGRALLARGEAAEAADRFATALSMDRGNGRFALALAEAALADRRPREAERTLRTLLDRSQSDGAGNLAMARVMMAEGRVADAKSYYHRAIFGRWGADSLRARRRARLELVRLLAARRDEAELLAELLPLEAADTGPMRRLLARLYLRAGAPARGVALFRELLAENPRDADAYGGLGEGALALGNFRTARADFQQAVALQPDDSSLRARLAVADSAYAISPTVRGIGAAARRDRSRALLERTLQWLGRCAPAWQSATLDSARAALVLSRGRRADPEAAAERSLSLAEELWTGRPAACRGAGPEDEPLAVVLAHLAQ